MDEEQLKRYRRRHAALLTDRSSWDAHWLDISENLLPRNSRFLTSDRNDGKKRHNKIYDSTGPGALRILAAGLMAGMTSPARPWFRLSIGDTGLMQRANVRRWLDDVSELMREVFSRSNTYRALHSVYEELGAFGTAASVVMPNFDNVVHHTPLTIGEYVLAIDDLRQTNTLYREFDMTVEQLVGQFTLKACSEHVKTLYARGNLDAPITVVHAVEPRRDRNPNRRDSKNMAYASVYFEKNGREKEVLRESGFRRFRVVAPRWAVTGNDTYGGSPGMEALGDLKELQHSQFRKAQALDYMTKPPLQAPTGLKGKEHNMLPGGMTYVDLSGPNAGIKPAWEVRLDLNSALANIQDVRQRLRETFYANLFMMVAMDDRSNITAREIAERHEEKLLMLGPVLERLHNELLSPLIDLTFEDMLEAGILPTPPQELQGQDISVQFVSVLAQAQRAVGVQSIDRLIGTIGAISSAKGDLSPWDKLDTDKAIDKYSDMLGVDPDLIVANPDVALIRNERAKQAQAMQSMAMAQAGAQTAKDLGQANTEGGTALGDLMSNFSGYSSPA